MTKKGYFPRHRYPIARIIIAILSHMFMASRDVSVFLYLLLRVRASHKTICEWTKKFVNSIPLRPLICSLDKILICHAEVSEGVLQQENSWKHLRCLIKALPKANCLFTKLKAPCQQNSTFSTVCVRILLVKRFLFWEIKVTIS